MTQTPDEARQAAIDTLLELAELIKSDPSVPTPVNIDVWAHLHPGYHGSESDNTEAIHDFAERHGTEVIAERGGHRHTKTAVGIATFYVHVHPAKSAANGAPHVVTRATDEALAAAVGEHGECLDERMVAEGDWPGRGRPPQHVESDAERGVCRNCGANVNDSYCSNPQPAAVSA